MQTKEIISQEWFQAMVEECSAIIVEAVHNSHWDLVEGYHTLGKRILEENQNFERREIYGDKIVSVVAKALRKSTRTVYNAIQAAKLYPDINSLPEGKAITWSKLCKNYLSKDAFDCKHDACEEVVKTVCSHCKRTMDTHSVPAGNTDASSDSGPALAVA
jgi:hypothetical protein